MTWIKCKLIACIRALASYINKRPIIVGFLVMILIMLIGFGILDTAIGSQTSFGFTEELYTPSNPVVCAGNTLVVPTRGVTSGQRTVNEVYESISSLDASNPFRFDTVRHVTSSTPREFEFDFLYTYVLPDDIPPGSFKLVYSVLQNGQSEVDGFDVFFTVDEC